MPMNVCVVPCTYDRNHLIHRTTRCVQNTRPRDAENVAATVVNNRVPIMHYCISNRV